jgi:hypothetical protein
VSSLLPDEPSDEHLLALAGHVLAHLDVDFMSDDAGCWRLLPGNCFMSPDTVLSMLGVEPLGPHGYVKWQREYGAKCRKALPGFLRRRVTLSLKEPR